MEGGVWLKAVNLWELYPALASSCWFSALHPVHHDVGFLTISSPP